MMEAATGSVEKCWGSEETRGSGSTVLGATLAEWPALSMHWQHVQNPPATADALPLLIPQPCKRCSRNRLRWQKQDAKKVCDLWLPVHSQGGKTVEMPLTHPRASGVPWGGHV